MVRLGSPCPSYRGPEICTREIRTRYAWNLLDENDKKGFLT